MALTAQQLEARIFTLQQARDSGLLSVGHGDDKVVYQSPASMDKTLQRLKRELDCLNGVTPRSRVNYIEQTSKGFGTFGDGNAGYGDSDEVNE